MFINGNYTGYKLCHHIYIERIIVKNTTAEAIYVDYAQCAYIKDCHTDNSAWAGCTLAQVKHGGVQNCVVLDSGIADIVDSLGVGINLQNITDGLIANNYIVGPRDIAIAVATQEAQYRNHYFSHHLTVKDNNIVEANNITADTVILIARTQGQSSCVRQEYIDIVNNSIDFDVGMYHGISIDDSGHLNVLDNKINVQGRNGIGKHGIFVCGDVHGIYHNGNYISSSYQPPVLVDESATDVVTGTLHIVP